MKDGFILRSYAYDWVTEYFREISPDDLSNSGQNQDLIDFIAKKFHRIRSFIRFACAHDHIYNICLINKDEKPLDEILTPFLKRYSCVFKINLSAGHILLQENNQLR